MYLVSFCAAKRLGTRLQEQGHLNLGLITRPVVAAWQQLQPPGPDVVAQAGVNVAGGPLGVVEKADELMPPPDTAQARLWGLPSLRWQACIGCCVGQAGLQCVAPAGSGGCRLRMQAARLPVWLRMAAWVLLDWLYSAPTIACPGQCCSQPCR